MSAIELYQMAAAAGNEQAIFQLTGLKADTLREDLDCKFVGRHYIEHFNFSLCRVCVTKTEFQKSDWLTKFSIYQGLI